MADDLKSTLLGFYERVSGGDLGVIDEVLADDMVEHENFPGIEPNKEGVKQVFATFRSAFPDYHIEAHEVVAEGDLVCARTVSTGTHEGDFMGMSATGKRVEFEAIDMVRFKDGQAVEHWGVSDALALMQQLGAIPGPPA